jgi:NAD(P)-dependent dehydrogenase (short-subunit alcohol dehydrogenase family)
MGGSYSQPAQVKDVHFPAFKAALPRLESKVIAITGTTSGTGFVAAQTCAELGAQVLLLNRPSERATSSLESLRKAVPGGKFEAVACDLQDLASVRAAAKEVNAKCPNGLDVLCNNAGVMALADESTKDGFDVQMQTNVIAPFLLTSLVMPSLERAAARVGEARVVMHSSIARYGKDLEAKYFEKGMAGKLGGNGNSMLFGGGRWVRYQQTKAADIVFTYALGDRLAAKGSKVITCVAHPGLAATNLQVTTTQQGGMSGTALVMKLSQSQRDGSMGIIRGIAGTPVASKSFFGPTGGQSALYGKAELLPHEPKFDSAKNKDTLWAACEKAVGPFFP